MMTGYSVNFLDVNWQKTTQTALKTVLTYKTHFDVKFRTSKLEAAHNSNGGTVLPCVKDKNESENTQIYQNLAPSSAIVEV